MNEYNDPDAFDGIINNGFATNPYTHNPQVSPPGMPAQPYTDPHPYGPPAHGHPARPVKTGLTPRGKAALAIAASGLAVGGLVFWQHHADTVAANQLKAQELQLQQQKLQVEQQKTLDKANQTAAKTQSVADKNRQKQIDACVQDNKGLVGKQLGQTLSGVISDCQNQYPASSTNTADMQEAANAQPTGSGDGTNLLLILGGVLVVVVIVGVMKGSRPAPAPTSY